MNSVNLGGFNVVNSNNSNVIKVKSATFYGSSCDTVSFSGRGDKSSTGLKAKLFSAFGLNKTEEVPSEPKIDKVWTDGDGVMPCEANSEFANSLRAMTYKAEHRDYGEYDAKMYSEAAIKTLVKYQKQSPELVEDLSRIFAHSDGLNKVDDFEYLAHKQMTSPEIVSKFGARSYSPYGHILFLKAYDKNPSLTDTLFEEKDSEGANKFGSSETYILVEAAEKHGEGLVKKYATDSRVSLTYGDITALCEKDAENSEKINELIQFVADNKMDKKARTAQISNLLTPYLADEETTKALMKFGVMDASSLSDFRDAYINFPEQMQLILPKQVQATSYYERFQNFELPKYAEKLAKYQAAIGIVSGSDIQDLTIRQLKILIDGIEKTVTDSANAYGITMRI